MDAAAAAAATSAPAAQKKAATAASWSTSYVEDAAVDAHGLPVLQASVKYDIRDFFPTRVDNKGSAIHYEHCHQRQCDS